MAFKSLQQFISTLEKNNELIRIKEYVNPVLEIAEITDRVSKSEHWGEGGKALLFENTGTNFPVLINCFGSEKRMCLALGVNNLEDIGDDIDDLFKKISGSREGIFDKLRILPTLSQLSSWMPKKISGKGVCQQVVNLSPDLHDFPILKCWPKDGGRFITLPMVITKDPINNNRNVGMYRMQVFEKDLTGMHWHRHKTGARHYEEYKKIGKKMPVAVALGGDPSYTYSATAPLPDNIDEFMLAGFLRKKRAELVRCITQDLEVPSDVDIVLEGYIDPEEELIWEGPFGDHTGFYSLADWFPRFHITCITYRDDAVYPATIVGIPPQEDAWIGKATERIFLKPIRISVLPEIIDIDLPVAGVAHNIAIAKIEKTYPGQGIKVASALWGAGQMMFNKIIIVCDGDIDIHNYKSLARNVASNFNPITDTFFSRGPLDILDHSSVSPAFGGKVCLDVTNKLPEEKVIINEPVHNEASFNKDLFIEKFDEIQDINEHLLLEGIPVIFISVHKKGRSLNDFLAIEMIKMKELCGVKIVVFADSCVDIYNPLITIWYCAGNIDALRDCRQVKSNSENGYGCLFIDGTRKTKTNDSFERDWPNIVVSDLNTINEIDLKWNALGLGKIINSPSLKYRDMLSGDEAIADQ